MPRKRSLLPVPSFTFRCGQGDTAPGPEPRGNWPLGYGPGDGQFSTLVDSHFPRNSHWPESPLDAYVAPQSASWTASCTLAVDSRGVHTPKVRAS